jgi:hypothetical protein
MKKRLKKKTQKELGYVFVGGFIPLELRDKLNRLAVANNRSQSAQIMTLIEQAVGIRQAVTA